MSDAGLGWTEERVELLGRLWGEGLSASQIAAQLGGGVTRNAVIGKVHRLGLAGRGRAGAPPPVRQVKPRPPSAPAPLPETVVRAVQPGAAAAETRVGQAVAAPWAEEAAIPVSQRVSILDLRETMCRWPLGDPASPEFGFCGARSVTGMPYCASHCRIAYQPASERKRIRA